MKALWILAVAGTTDTVVTLANMELWSRILFYAISTGIALATYMRARNKK